MSENKKDNKNIGQFLKFVAFSCSAGLIQIGSFTLMSEVLIKLSFFQGLMQSNATFAKIMENEYGPMYLIALILSVVYLINTSNFTKKNKKNTTKNASLTAINYIVLGITMIVNMVTEYLFDKFVVF